MIPRGFLKCWSGSPTSACPGVNRVLERWGLRVGTEPVVEPKNNLFRDLRFAVHYMYANDSEVTGNVSIGNDLGYAVMFTSRVKVADNGFGIEEKHLDNIFKRFYRVKNEKTRFITGTGLGLPIVKELVTTLNGFIDVESVSGKGSVFTVLLPAGEAE